MVNDTFKEELRRHLNRVHKKESGYYVSAAPDCALGPYPTISMALEVCDNLDKVTPSWWRKTNV